ncbi:MAG: hypothetical protein NZO16_06060 [Deltaproteobacteria bacterium]|nr:hypothetical protein [Deltaproteobacteria bacterium]
MSDDDFNALLKELKKIRDPRIAFHFETEKTLQNLFKLLADPKYQDLLRNDIVLNFVQAAVSLIQASPVKFFYQVNQALKLERETYREKAKKFIKRRKLKPPDK